MIKPSHQGDQTKAALRIAFTAAPLQRNGDQALYLQLAAHLRMAIAQGQSRLPTERQLADDFAVGRVTVRRALALLAQDRLISRRPRSGTRALSAPA